MKHLVLFFWIFFLVCASSVVASDINLAKAREVAASKYWQRLLHYKMHWLGGWKSSVDGQGFFSSPQGKTDPYAELMATVDAFSRNIKIGRYKVHPQCAFPERFRFLRQELDLKIPAVKCPEFQAYLDQFHAASAALVFSSAYPGNPGSMFGHTFLRINAKPQKKTEKKLDLLDHGLSYAANTAGKNSGILFAFYGIFGGYIGQFSIMPYYVKVNEYINSESRDIWEYELNLNEEETTRLLANAWEIETNSYFDYFFFDENCAYQLLTLLEVAKPEWNVSYYYEHLIPGESVQRLANTPGAIKSIKFRPSLRKKMYAKYEALSEEKKNIFRHAQSDESFTVKDYAVLDSLIAFTSFEKQKDESKFSLSGGPKKISKLLVARSKLEDPEWKGNPISEASRPDLSHGSYRLAWSNGLQDSASHDGSVYFTDLHFKVAYHDLLNDDTGFPPFSEINFPNFSFRYIPKEKKFFLQELQISSLVSLSPWTALEKGLSWRFSVSDAVARDLKCEQCHLWNFNSGAGFSLYPFTTEAVFYSMLLLQVEAGAGLARSVRYGPKLNLGLLMAPFPKNKVQIEANRFFDVWQNERQKYFTLWQLKHAYAFNKHWDLREEFSYWQRSLKTQANAHEYKLGFSYYF